jgi:hypothetical protein
LEGFGIEDVGIVYVQCVYVMTKWYILWPLGTFCGPLVYFSRFGMLYREKSGNPVVEHHFSLETVRQVTQQLIIVSIIHKNICRRKKSFDVAPPRPHLRKIEKKWTDLFFRLHEGINC